MLGMTYFEEERMSLCLSYWTTNGKFLNIYNRTIATCSIQSLVCKNSPSDPSLSNYLLAPYQGFFFFCFFSFAGRGVGAICELKPKKNRVISLAMWDPTTPTCPDLKGVKILHVTAFGRPVRKKSH